MRMYTMLLLCMAAAGCETLDPGISLSPPRWESHRPVMREDIPGKGPHMDTAVFVSAVRAPESYDWIRDTAWDAAGCELLLYRDSSLLLTVPTGKDRHVSADPDLHHVINGRLYTEYADRNRSYVGRDGKILFSWEGRDLILGLLDREDGLWTLGRPRSGEGFCLRKDGQPVLAREDGRVIGRFGAPGYWQQGALYIDNGDICFCYKILQEGRETLYMVRNGTESVIFSTAYLRTLDARVIDGDICTLCREGSSTMMKYRGNSWDLGFGGLLLWADAGITLYREMLCAAGVYEFTPYEEDYSGLAWPDSYDEFECPDGLLFTDGQRLACYDGPLAEGRMMTECCGAVTGGRFIMALSPREIEKRPCLWEDGAVTEFNINGFLTGVDVVVSPAS